MPEPLFSNSWYRVAELKPRLRGHARIHRHRYRGRLWYVLQDVSNQRFHRFTPAARTVISLMDGVRSVQEVWEIALESLGDDAPTQDDVVRLLGQLHAADVLQCDVPPDTLEILERQEKRERREWQGKLMSPFAIKVPLLDPEKLLRRMDPFLRPLISLPGALLWLAVVLPALVLVGLNWSELSEGALDRILSVQNALLLWVLFPLIKAFHEFGHGAVAKRYGGEIHEMGIMFLVFTPVPYVDASSSSAFPERHRRALVGAAGMIVEVFLAALALYVWVLAEPGAVRTVAWNAMLIGGVTTLAFNLNPLLRFDGYYILTDWIEIPNLRNRANAYLGYLVERHVFGRREAEAPEASRSERAWFVGYAVAAWVYRLFVMAAIFLWVMSISLVLGTLLAGIAIFGWIGRPLVKGVRFLFFDPRLRRQRGRAVGAVAGFVAVLGLLVLALPFPYRTQTEGVVWIPDEALVRARTPGFIQRVVATPGSRVAVGDVLVECADPDLDAESTVLAARLGGLHARYQQTLPVDRARAEMIDEERRHITQRLARLRERQQDLVIRAATPGVFVMPKVDDWAGRFVQQGQLLAHVVDLATATVRTVVHQEDIELVQERMRKVEVRLAERPGPVHEAVVKRIVPTASDALPHPALGSGGGGRIAIDPREEGGANALDKLFEVEIALPPELSVGNVGGRVHVRFDLGRAPLGGRVWRQLRQVFLSRLQV